MLFGTNLYRVTDALYAKKLISLGIVGTMRDMYSMTGENESMKAGKLVIVLNYYNLEASSTPEKSVIN